jgi:hypothetical protein
MSRSQKVKKSKSQEKRMRKRKQALGREWLIAEKKPDAGRRAMAIIR